MIAVLIILLALEWNLRLFGMTNTLMGLLVVLLLLAWRTGLWPFRSTDG